MQFRKPPHKPWGLQSIFPTITHFKTTFTLRCRFRKRSLCRVSFNLFTGNTHIWVTVPPRQMEIACSIESWSQVLGECFGNNPDPSSEQIPLLMNLIALNHSGEEPQHKHGFLRRRVRMEQANKQKKDARTEWRGNKTSRTLPTLVQECLGVRETEAAFRGVTVGSWCRADSSSWVGV